MGGLTANLNLYVDLQGRIWKGYLPSSDNLHYSRLCGVTNGRECGVIQPIWVQERSESDPSWILIGIAN